MTPKHSANHRHGPPNGSLDDTLRVQSSWLQQFPVPVRLTEILPQLPSHCTSRPLHEATASTLRISDVPIIVCNPLTTSVESLLSYASLPLINPNTILVFTTNSPSSELIDHITASLPRSDVSRILFIDPSRAHLALHTLECNPTSAAAIQRYQDEFVSSRISTLTKTISELLSRPRDLKGLSQIYGALSACNASLVRARREIDDVCTIISELTYKVEEAGAKIEGEVFGIGERDEVVSALQEAEKRMRVTLDALTWWKMIWRVDDIATIVGTAAEKCWCPRLERRVSFVAPSLGTVDPHPP